MRSLFDKREDANDWIFRRHTGAADGEGRIAWGPLEIDRFSGARSVLDVIDFIGRNAAFTEEEWASTKAMIESRKSSNLARLIESKPLKTHLNMAILKSGQESIPVLGSQPKWAIKVLKRIIEDIRDGVIDSRNLNKASEIDDYLNSLPKDLRSGPKHTGPSLPFKEINLKAGKESEPSTEGETKKTKRKPAPRPRRSLAPKKHTFEAPSSAKGQHFLREASLIDVEKYKLSSAFLLRAFIELAVHDYMRANKLPFSEKIDNGETKNLDLTTRTSRVVSHIVQHTEFTNADMRGFKTNILTKSSPTSIQSLNNFVHNKFQIPVSDSLRSGWDCSVPLFIAAFGEP